MLYTVGRFLHFAGLLIWVSGLYTLDPLVKRLGRPGASEILEPKLLKQSRVVMHAGMGTALTGGTMMIVARSDLLLPQHWLHLKLLLVVVLMGATVKLGRDARKVSPTGAPVGNLAFHIVTGTLVVAIVFLAVFRPF